jgi:hypothetical protein
LLVAEIGDNGGPPLEKWTAARKIERIKQILETSMSSAQKCIGVGIVAHADTDGIAAEMSTALLQTIASVKDRETVYRATERLEREAVAAKHRVEGRPNNYRVMPARVMKEIEDAFVQHTSRVQPDGVVGSNPTGVEKHTGRVEPDGVVGSNPTSPVQPVGLNPTGASDVARTHAPAHGIARTEGIYNNNNNLPQNNKPSHPEPREAEVGVEVNCVLIKGPNFSIDLIAVDQAAMLSGISTERARMIAEMYAREWAANGTKPNHPMAYLKKMIAADKNDAAIAEVRLTKATTGPQRQAASAAPETSSRRARLAAWADEIKDSKGSRK